MRTIILSTQFKKDIKLARKRHLPLDEMNRIVFNLANDIPLTADKHDHQLYGDYVGYRECHIMPDWLLIYRKTDSNGVEILNMYRSGTHSDLFGKTKR